MIVLWAEHEGDTMGVCFLLFYTFAAVYRYVFLGCVFLIKCKLPQFLFSVVISPKYIFLEVLVFILSVPCFSSDLATWLPYHFDTHD